MVCYLCLVSGHVQGICFRYSTRQKALQLQLTGSAINLANGQVEVHVCGSAESVLAFKHWLRQGPDWAKVDNLECEEIGRINFDGFEIG